MTEVIAPINIALLKYWGKSDELNIFPATDSLSLTLNAKHLHSRTHLSFSSGVGQTFSLNGKTQTPTNRMKDVLIVAQMRAMRKNNFTRFQQVHIRSSNNFPTAAGLASSASGMASLAYGLSVLYGLDGDCAALARRGSGSACRSLFGGVVHWKSPTSSNCQLSQNEAVEQLFPYTYWPELRVLICVTSSHSKQVGSSVAMRRTVKTSPLFLEARAAAVRERLPLFLDAIAQRNFAALAELTMRESNELHALCLDTWPPAVYLNETSFAIINFVHAVNAKAGRCVLAYTFDAGPNAFILTLEQDAALVLWLLTQSFGSPLSIDNCVDANGENGDKGVVASKRPRLETAEDDQTPSRCRLDVRGIQYERSDSAIATTWKESSPDLPRRPGGIQYIISTDIGPGPQRVDNQ